MEVITEKDIEVVIDSAGEVSTNSALEVDVVDNTELAVSVNRKEFNIVGDELYIPKRYEDAPQWLRDLISTVTEESYTQKITELNNLSTSLQQLIVELEVAKNTYTQSIISSNDIDERINAAITTLNSSLAGSDATIVDLITTRATPDEASAIALNAISSSINNGEIGALIGSVSSTLATETEALANNIDLVHAEMSNGFEGTADAIQLTQSYVGIDEAGAVTGTGLLADVQILQKQNDGVIETVTGTYDVMLGIEDPNNNTDNDQLDVTKEPYASWLAEDVANGNTAKRSAHVGDVYIKYSNSDSGYKSYEKAYKFIKTVVDTTSPYATDSEGFTWSLIVDTDAQNAYVTALNAYDLADDKRRVFVSTPYSPIDEGDLWVTGTNPQVVKVYKSGNWVLADTQVDTFVNSTYVPTVTSLQNQVDGKVESWYTLSTNDPKTAWTDASTRAKHDGDMWYQKDTKLSYYYSSSTNSWNLIDDAKAIQALADAATAQATADGKISSYYMSTLAAANVMSNAWTATEKTNNIGDLVVVWDDSTLDNNGTWRWNGTSWVSTRDKKLIALASDVTNLSTELTNGTNTWASADSTLENSLRTEITDESARVESKFAYNSTLMLNGTSYSSGFGIATSLTSGSGLPTGQSEFWIKADKFKLMSADGGKKSSYSPFTVDSVTGEINFNGKVTFSNVTNVPQLGSTPQEVVNAVNSGQTTTISGGRITTGSITADQIQANSVSADRLLAGTNATTVWTGGGLVSSNFNGNPYDSIGTPTRGFRLSANAAGTSTDPNIYGAYIKGAILEGTALTVSDVRVKAEGYPNNFGDILISKTYMTTSSINSATFVPRNYATGYNPLRICSSNGEFNIFVQAFSAPTYISMTYQEVRTACFLDISTDNGTTFTNVASNSGLYGFAGINYTYTHTALTTVIFRMRVSVSGGWSGISVSGNMQINLINN